jgi:lipoprotein-anchoring transpeptidase ErfK/SrfK
VNARQRLKIAPGPNNPVGSVWMSLNERTYGIHGTADPAKIGKTYSHSCVRLTNWDAKILAAMVKKSTYRRIRRVTVRTCVAAHRREK